MGTDMLRIFGFLNTAAIASSLVAAMLWYRAGARKLHRIARSATLDTADLSRMDDSMNRSAIPNYTAALGSAVSVI